MIALVRLCKPLALLGLAALLAACAAEPSEAEIKAAFDREQAATVNAMRGLFGQTGADVTTQMQSQFGVQSVRKIGCKSDGDNASLCDLELEVRGLGGLQKTTQQLRFVKGSEGWMLAGR